MVSVESLSLMERTVLLSITETELAGETPAESMTIKRQTVEILNVVEAETIGNPDEADIMRSLSVLGSKPYIEEDHSNTSPSGKGRPKYALDTEPESILDALGDDDTLGPAVERLTN